MKKLFFILFLPFILSCSDDDDVYFDSDQAYFDVSKMHSDVYDFINVHSCIAPDSSSRHVPLYLLDVKSLVYFPSQSKPEELSFSPSIQLPDELLDLLLTSDSIVDNKSPYTYRIYPKGEKSTKYSSGYFIRFTSNLVSNAMPCDEFIMSENYFLNCQYRKITKGDKYYEEILFSFN